MAKILVVDDDERNLRLAQAILMQAEHQVLTAGGGTEGVEAAIAHLPDLVLMDVQMPDLDGVSALRILRADPRTTAMRVLAVTGLAMNGDANRLLAEGFDGYLSKPVRYKALLAEIDRLLAEGPRS